MSSNSIENVITSAANVKNCGICDKSNASYTCPKCFLPYCSVSCYRSQKHDSCSEDFYKQCILEDLKVKSNSKSQAESKVAMEDILRQMREEEETIDSDDSSDSDPADLADRLENIDLESPDEIWNALTEKEKKRFEGLVESNEIIQLLPKFQPWWTSHTLKPVQEVTEESPPFMPPIKESIPPLSQAKDWNPFIIHGLTNALYAYCCITRVFQHSWSNPNETGEMLLNISANLKCGQHFSNKIEAIDHARVLAKELKLSEDICLVAKSDVSHIMRDGKLVLASLSDMLRLLERVKPKRQVFAVVKKIEFYLSYMKSNGV